MNEQYIVLLERQLEELTKVGSNPTTRGEYSFGVDAWKSATIGILERIFGPDSRKIREVEKIELGHSYNISGPTQYYIETFKETGRAIIEACISELTLLGGPEQLHSEGRHGFNLTVSQSQDNHQTIKLDLIVNELRNQLTGAQLSEIQEILDAEDPPDQKKSRTIDKLKEFGINTLSNIITGILTNPAIIG